MHLYAILTNFGVPYLLIFCEIIANFANVMALDMSL